MDTSEKKEVLKKIMQFLYISGQAAKIVVSSLRQLHWLALPASVLAQELPL